MACYRDRDLRLTAQKKYQVRRKLKQVFSGPYSIAEPNVFRGSRACGVLQSMIKNWEDIRGQGGKDFRRSRPNDEAILL